MATTRNDPTFRRETILSRLPKASCDALAALWRMSEYEEGSLIVGEGDMDNDLFFILEGEVRAAIFTLTGSEVGFRDVSPGDCFGEIAAIDKQSRVASIIARTDVRVARLSSVDFDQLIRVDPDFSIELLHLIAGKLRDLSFRVVDFSELTVAQRVRRELLRFARKERRGLDDAMITKLPAQGEIATIIFASREAVAREMASLGRLGIIERRASNLFVPSVRRLEAETMRG